jgi:hypothetical protein
LRARNERVRSHEGVGSFLNYSWALADNLGFVNRYGAVSVPSGRKSGLGRYSFFKANMRLGGLVIRHSNIGAMISCDLPHRAGWPLFPYPWRPELTAPGPRTWNAGIRGQKREAREYLFVRSRQRSESARARSGSGLRSCRQIEASIDWTIREVLAVTGKVEP